MKKILFLFIFLPLMLILVTACDPEDGMQGAQGQQGITGQQGEEGPQGNQGDDGSTPVVTVVQIAVGDEPCVENGGNTVVVTTGTDVQMIDICNPEDGTPGMDGSQGDQGDPGMDSLPITTTMTDASLADCPFGGDVITIFQGGVQVGVPIIICDGEDGTNLELACGDLTDNDGDSLIDCADPDCAGQVSVDPNDPALTVTCNAIESGGLDICLDGFDNDGDGDIDVDDNDCFFIFNSGGNEVTCGPGFFTSNDIEANFATFNLNQCTCDFTTRDDTGTLIEMITDGPFGVVSIVDCGVDLDTTLPTPTTFDVTISCESTTVGVTATPLTLTGCPAQ